MCEFRVLYDSCWSMPGDNKFNHEEEEAFVIRAHSLLCAFLQDSKSAKFDCGSLSIRFQANIPDIATQNDQFVVLGSNLCERVLISNSFNNKDFVADLIAITSLLNRIHPFYSGGVDYLSLFMQFAPHSYVDFNRILMPKYIGQPNEVLWNNTIFLCTVESTPDEIAKVRKWEQIITPIGKRYVPTPEQAIYDKHHGLVIK